MKRLPISFFVSCYGEQPQFVNVCFWYIPPSLRGKENSPDYKEKLAKVDATPYIYIYTVTKRGLVAFDNVKLHCVQN